MKQGYFKTGIVLMICTLYITFTRANTTGISDSPSLNIQGTVSIVAEGDTTRVGGSHVFILGVPAEISHSNGEDSQLMDQVNQTFTPHILPTTVGEKIRFKNSDAANHNVRLSRKGNNKILMNKMTYPGQSVHYTFQKKGVISVQCDLHPSMQAYIPVLGKPFIYRRSTEKGKFSFALPDSLAGRSFTAKAWSEQHGWSEEQQIVLQSDTAIAIHYRK